MNDAELEAAARLWDAARLRIPCPPVRSLIGTDDIGAAYRVQQANVARARDELGWHVCGRKIGLTSPAVQAQLGVDQPDFGALYRECGHASGDTVDVGQLLQPRVEAEVALVLGADLDGEQHTIDDVAAATESVVAALEIVDSRVESWDIAITDTVADNASGAHHVLGATPDPLDGLDLAAVEMTLSLDGTDMSTGTGHDCMGSPLLAARWLADTLAGAGTPLRAGDVVLTGALGPMIPARPGVFDATVSGLGVVSVEFTDRPPHATGNEGKGDG